jgi:hypothetical protein
MKKILVVLSFCLALMLIAPGCGSGTNKIDAEMGVSALAALADGHISGYVNSMDALALTEEVQSAQWEDMEELLKKVEDAGTGGIVWFVLPDGSYYTVEDGLTDQNLSDRDYFEGLMDGNKVLGSLVVSKATGKESLIAAVPVRSGGDVVGAIGSSIFLEELSSRLASDIDLPDNMMFWATTEDGEIALCSDPSMILNENAELPEGGVSKTSPLTDWQFTLAFKD